MGTLMRTVTLLFLGILFASPASVVEAQTITQRLTQPAWEDRGYFHVSFGGQTGDQEFTESSTFDIYGERGAVAAGHTIGGGTLTDISLGGRVWKNLGVGLAYSTISNKNDATVSARVPHPIIFGQSREATTTVSDLEHKESAVHLQFLWMLPLTNKIQVAFMIGPSFFTVRQQIASLPNPRQNITDVAPFTTVTINNVTVTEVKDSPVGINIGFDATYMLTTPRIIASRGVRLGAGFFLRYAGASPDFSATEGTTRDGEIDAGGVQAGLGLRLRF